MTCSLNVYTRYYNTKIDFSFSEERLSKEKQLYCTENPARNGWDCPDRPTTPIPKKFVAEPSLPNNNFELNKWNASAPQIFAPKEIQQPLQVVHDENEKHSHAHLIETALESNDIGFLLKTWDDLKLSTHTPAFTMYGLNKDVVKQMSDSEHKKINSILIFAIRTNNEILFEELLPRLNSDQIHAQDQRSISPFLWTAFAGRLGMLKEIFVLDHERAKITKLDGGNVFHIAAYANHIDIISYLLEQRDLDCLINSENKNGTSPLVDSLEKDEVITLGLLEKSNGHNIQKALTKIGEHHKYTKIFQDKLKSVSRKSGS